MYLAVHRPQITGPYESKKHSKTSPVQQLQKQHPHHNKPSSHHLNKRGTIEAPWLRVVLNLVLLRLRQRVVDRGEVTEAENIDIQQTVVSHENQNKVNPRQERYQDRGVHLPLKMHMEDPIRADPLSDQPDDAARDA